MSKTIKDRITDLVSEAYAEFQVVVEPIYPKVMIRTLPRSQMSQTGKIMLPEKQNKILIEGVVLGTYKPFWQRIFVSTDGAEAVTYKSENYPDRKQVDAVWREPRVKIGDHVLLAHFEGQPVSPLSDDYRLVNEDVIQCRLDYEAKGGAAKDVVELIGGYEGLDTRVCGPALTEIVDEKFHVIRKDLRSLTVSGV